MPFTDRFQLLDLKRDEGARTFEAREIATGRPVLVHLFADARSPLSRVLLVKLDTLPEHERQRIIDRGAHEGGIYLVTDRLAEYGGLREWLKVHHEDRPKPMDARGAWQIKPVAEPPVSTLGNSAEQTLQMPAPPVNEPGAFTREFAPPVLRPAPPSPSPSPSPAPAQPGEFTRLFSASPPKTAAPQQKPVPAPGEFTRLFQAPQRPAPAPVPRVPAAPQPGEFTQMLQAHGPSAPAPPAKQPSQTGEFTRFFESPMAPQPQSAPLTPPRPPSQPKDAGEFTQVFGRGDIPSPPPTSPPSAPNPAASANATQVFATPRQPSPPPIVTPLAPPQAIPQGPGEYTQMFAKPASLTFGQAPAGAPIPVATQPMRQKRNNSRLPLLLVVGAVVLLAMAIVIYFVMRSHTT